MNNKSGPSGPLLLFEWIFSLNNSNEEKNDCKYKEDMNKWSKDMEAKKSDKPKHEEHNGNSCKHICNSLS